MLACRVASVHEQTTVSSEAHNDAIRQLIAIGEERDPCSARRSMPSSPWTALTTRASRAI